MNPPQPRVARIRRQRVPSKVPRPRAASVRVTALRGMVLLEAVVALCVFSVGILGLLGLLAGALATSGSAQWRNEGFDIAAAGIGRMSAEAPATLAARYDAAADGDGYRRILARAMRLPGVSAQANAPRVTIDDTTEGRRIRVTVQWQLPGEPVAHRTSVAAVLPHS